MKKCSVFLFLLVTLAAVGQKEYRIEGKCGMQPEIRWCNC